MINETMRLNVKMINSYTFPVDIHRKGSIGLLKQKIYEKINLVPSKQRLIFQGKVLLNDKLLNEYHLEENDVIHLIEQTLDSNNHNHIQHETASTRGDESFNNLLSSLFLPNPFVNTHNNNSINNTMSNNTLRTSNNNNDIPDSFHHLIKKSNFIQTKSIETITQGINSLYDMINRSKHIMLNEAPLIKNLYSNDENNNYKIGQWVDVKDSSDQWIEGQIANKSRTEVNVHYLGLTNQINHWIDSGSKRIALFRSFTSQDLNNQFASPFPDKADANNCLSIDPQKKYDPLTNDLITFVDYIKEKITKLMKQRDAIKDHTYFRTKDDLLNNERFYYIQLMQLYPLMDRLGRLLTDISCYLMNMSFKFFEDNIYLFKSNIQDERLSFLNFNERNAELIREKEIKEFVQLTEYSVIKMKKIESEVRRPVLGLLVNVHRNERRDTIFSQNRLTVQNENSFYYSSIKPIKIDKGIQEKRNNYFNYITVVPNEYFSIDRILIETMKTVKKEVNSNSNNNKSYIKSNNRITKMQTNEKVVLVSRDKPIVESTSTLVSQINSKKVRSSLNNNNGNENVSKKKYRLSQSKGTIK